MTNIEALVTIAHALMRNRHPHSWLATGGADAIADDVICEAAMLIDATPDEYIAATEELKRRFMADAREDER